MSARTQVAASCWRCLSRLAASLLLAASPGISGCSTAPVVASAIRGSRDGPEVAVSNQPQSPAIQASTIPGSWDSAREPERPVQWAEARTVTAPQPTTSNAEIQVAWRSQEKSLPAPPPVIDQGPVLGPLPAPPSSGPGQQVEQMPAPRVMHADQEIVGPAPVVVLGAPLPKAPNELRKVSLPAYTVAPPDILMIESTRGLPSQPVRGQHLIRPDGTLNLGVYGNIYVAGMTLDQVAGVVAKAIESRLEPEVVQKNPVKVEDVVVDVLAYNSKLYYVITDGGGYGEQVYKFPATGNETVLDAIANISGLPAVASKKHIWVARRTPHGIQPLVLPVDWCGIAQRGETVTNYQLFPGDRVYVQADRLITADNWLAKLLAPVERVLGVTLLGSSTVNSIRNRGTGTGGTP